MNYLYYFALFLLLHCGKMLGQTIDVAFHPDIKSDYYPILSIPINHSPNSYVNSGPITAWFCYPDNSLFFLTRRKTTPNSGIWMKDRRFYEVLAASPIEQFVQGNDTMYKCTFSGIDSNGLFWKDVVFISQKPQEINTMKPLHIEIIGYVFVKKDRLDIFEKIISSYKRSNNKNYGVREQNEYRVFKYLGDTTSFLNHQKCTDFFSLHIQRK